MASSSAVAAPPGFEDALQRKYDILQQQADAETARAESEKVRAEAEARSIDNQGAAIRRQNRNYAPLTVPSGDGLAGTNAPTCTLPGGTSIRVSGGLRPSEGTACSNGK